MRIFGDEDEARKGAAINHVSSEFEAVARRQRSRRGLSLGSGQAFTAIGFMGLVPR